MDKLQELLDKKWPIKETTTQTDKRTLNWLRGIFAEGYNAAIQEMRGNVLKQTGKELTEREILERDYNPNWDHSDFHTIK